MDKLDNNTQTRLAIRRELQRTPRDSAKDYFVMLEGVRGIAAIAVALRHMWPTIFPMRVPVSYLAVDIFFLLSGIVIANSYEARLTNGQMGFFSFIEKRLIRLYPMYVLGIALGVVSVLVRGDDRSQLLGQIVSAAFYFPYIQGSSPFPLNAPAWSLVFELAINIAYAAILVKVYSKVSLLGCVIALAVLGVAVFYGNNALDVGFRNSDLLYGFPRVFYSFMLGVILYRLHASSSNWARLSFGRGNRSALLLMAVFAAIMIAPIPQGQIRGIYSLLAVGFVFPIVTLAALNATPNVFTTNILKALGSISYPLYSIHFPLYNLINAVLSYHGVNIERYAPLSGLALIIVFCATAYLVNAYVDLPVRSFFAQWVKSLRSRLKTA